MGQAAFYPDFSKFCMEWVTPIPGNSTTYGGPVRTGSETFRRKLRSHKEIMFEHLLVFDSITLDIRGPNVIVPLLYRFMGDRVLEELLEQEALSFTVWTPQPMLAHDRVKITSTFAGRVGDGKGSELDLEKIIDLGLRIQNVNMPDWYRSVIKTKLISRHNLLDPKLSETAWPVVEDALKKGELKTFGLSKRDSIINSSSQDSDLLNQAAEAILGYRYVLQNGMAAPDQEVFKIFSIGKQQLDAVQSPMGRYAVLSEFEKFPNLRELYGVLEKPFEQAAEFRKTYTAQKFRDWISTSTNTSSEIEIIREYVNACSKRKGLFESKPAKFFRLTAMIAVGHLVLPEAHLLGDAVGALLSGIPASVVGQITETASEFGLGVIDSFMIDNVKVGWTPKAYFDRLKRLQRKSNS